MKFKLVEAAESKICCICKKPFDGYGNNAEPVCSGSCCDECNMKKVIPARMKLLDNHSSEDLDESLKEGNAVSGKIPPALDSFLQDIAQMYGTIDYGDIMDHDYTEDDISSLFSPSNHLCCLEWWVTEDVRADRKNEKWINIICQKT